MSEMPTTRRQVTRSAFNIACMEAHDDELRIFEASGATPLPVTDDQGYVENDAARIWYSAYGIGPPVILLHGGLGHSGNWGYQVPALIAKGYRAVVIDSRGHGRSTRDGRPYSYELVASDVLAVMNALHLDRADANGANAVQLVRDSRVNLFPRWSPDGNRIVYLSGDSSDILRGGEYRSVALAGGPPQTLLQGYPIPPLISAETAGCFIKQPPEKCGPMTRAMAKIWFWAACRPMHGTCSGHRTADPSPICVGRTGKMIRMLVSG